jgi:toxin FitB
MIVLDTNVVSEAMKPEPHPAVRAWLNDQVAQTLYLSSVTLAELLFGIGALPAGRRKDMLTRALDGLIKLFSNQVLPFDTDAAKRYADLAVAAKASGRGFPTPLKSVAGPLPRQTCPHGGPDDANAATGGHASGYIAAIAASRGFIVASRDVAPYAAAGVTVINPWEA